MDAGWHDRAKADYDRCLAAYAPVAAQLGAYHESEYLARLSFYELTFGGDARSALEHARVAHELAPDSSLVGYILTYALMYNGEEEAFLRTFDEISGRGENERQNFREDFKMLRTFGLDHPLMQIAEGRL